MQMTTAQITAHFNIIINLNGVLFIAAARLHPIAFQSLFVLSFATQRNVIAILVFRTIIFLFYSFGLWKQLPVARTKSSYSCLPLFAAQSFFMQATAIKSRNRNGKESNMQYAQLSREHGAQLAYIWRIMSSKLLNIYTKINLHTKHTASTTTTTTTRISQRWNSNSRSR